MEIEHAIPHNGVDTSVLAAASIPEEGRVGLCSQIFTRIQETGGMTCWEIEQEMVLKHQTASARLWDLRKAGFIIDSGERRLTGSRRRAIVWVLVPR